MSEFQDIASGCTQYLFSLFLKDIFIEGLNKNVELEVRSLDKMELRLKCLRFTGLCQKDSTPNQFTSLGMDGKINKDKMAATNGTCHPQLEGVLLLFAISPQNPADFQDF